MNAMCMYNKMDAIFMNLENSKISDPHRFKKKG